MTEKTYFQRLLDDGECKKILAGLKKHCLKQHRDARKEITGQSVKHWFVFFVAGSKLHNSIPVKERKGFADAFAGYVTGNSKK